MESSKFVSGDCGGQATQLSDPTYLLYLVKKISDFYTKMCKNHTCNGSSKCRLSRKILMTVHPIWQYERCS